MKFRILGPVFVTLCMCGRVSSQAGVAGLPPELLVARAAAAVATINFERSLEDRALRDLAAALRQEPRNTQARALLDLIQKRREERAKQQGDKGQQQLREQQKASQEEPVQQQQVQRRSDQARANERAATNKIAGSDQRNQISREEAQQLLDALEQQDRRPTQRLPTRNPRQGPRW